MPELPEVECSRRALLAAGCRGLKLQRLKVHNPSSLRDEMDLAQRLAQGSLSPPAIKKIARRGKWIILQLEQGAVLVHLGMSGRLWLEEEQEHALPSNYERVRVILSDGRHLRFYDIRKFGKVICTTRPDSHVGHLGVEPLTGDFTVVWFTELLRKHSQMIKALLFRQELVAGLGNIYIDEALWEAALHPCRAANSLSHDEVRGLYRAIGKVLEKGIKNCGTNLGKGMANFNLPNIQSTNQEYLQAYGQGGSPCSRCGKAIIKKKVYGRGSHICPHCQKLGKH